MSATATSPDSPAARRHLDELIQWLAIPSVSSEPRHAADMQRGMQWIAEKFERAGLETRRIETEGHPMVFAQTPPITRPDGSPAPVVLVYGHYDVQPVEPLVDWISGPFEPTIRDGNLYARGATDDKGQVLTHVQSVCDVVASGEPLGLQIKFLIEGEEEVGSKNLERMLPQLADTLACDCVVISDSSQYADGQPAITYGLRGIATYELHIDGPDQDLHSGSFGGAVLNPAIALTRILSKIVDSDGRIQVPHFYDDVATLDPAERTAWKSLNASDEKFAAAIGVPSVFGETGFSTDERRWARPTFDINGITSGHQGEGVKTIIPATASAKFSFRLVPNQDPQAVTENLQRFVSENMPAAVTFRLQPGHGAPGMVANVQSPFIAAATIAIESAFGTPPVMIREGGSIPIVARFAEALNCDCLLMGWGLSDDNCHSPNEKFRVADYHRGIAASTALWKQLGRAAG